MTRGIRNNNPGNIRKSNIAWLGKIPGNDPDFETFDTPEHGIRALAVNLKTYQEKYGLNTIYDIISRWAPPSENDTAAYMESVARSTGIPVNEVISLSNPVTLTKFVNAIIHHENGMNPYTGAEISTGIATA